MPLNKHVLVKLMIMVELPFSGHPCEFCKCCIIAIWIHYLLDSAVQDIIVRVVSSEISGGKFPAIYSNLSGNFRKFVNYLCQSAISKSNIAK